MASLAYVHFLLSKANFDARNAGTRSEASAGCVEQVLKFRKKKENVRKQSEHYANAVKRD